VVRSFRDEFSTSRIPRQIGWGLLVAVLRRSKLTSFNSQPGSVRYGCGFALVSPLPYVYAPSAMIADVKHAIGAWEIPAPIWPIPGSR